MFNMLSPQELLGGIDMTRRSILMNFFKTPWGIELAWASLVITYGLLATLPMVMALPVLLFRTARPLDRSAFYMTILFLVVTAGSLSFGVKSLAIVQIVVLILTLCQPEARQRRRAGGLAFLRGEQGEALVPAGRS